MRNHSSTHHAFTHYRCLRWTIAFTSINCAQATRREYNRDCAMTHQPPRHHTHHRCLRWTIAFTRGDCAQAARRECFKDCAITHQPTTASLKPQVPEVDNCLTTGELHKLMEQHGVTHLSQGASVCVCAVWLCVCVCCVAVCVCVCVCVCESVHLSQVPGC